MELEYTIYEDSILCKKKIAVQKASVLKTEGTGRLEGSRIALIEQTM